MTDMASTCPDCGHRLVWHIDEENDELAERIRALEAERIRPVPLAPIDPRQLRRGHQ